MRASPFLLALPFALAACSGAFNSQSPPEPTEHVTLPGPTDAALPPAAAEPEDLPGIDTSSLNRREKERFWKLVTQLYAPCSADAVSLATCVKEQRTCAACAPAVKLIAEKVHEGALVEQAQNAYAIRFGPKVKQVDAADSPTKGPASAPVTIVEWFDFECPHCKLAGPMLDRLIQNYPGQVRLVHKFYPLHAHARAEPAARAAIAAQNQGKYWEMERMIFAHQADLTDVDLDAYAAQLKLDPKRFRADMASDRTTQILTRDREDADRFGLSGTPFMMINGREFDLGLFHLDSDLEPWVALEVKLKGGGI